MRTIYVAGVNTRKLANQANDVKHWLLSATLLRTRVGLPEWIRPYLVGRKVLWDPGTFSKNAINYASYRSWVDCWSRSTDEYLQYDEVGDPESTAWYLADMRRRGYDPIPVLQPGGSLKLLSEPRLAIGGTVRMSKSTRRQYLDDIFYTLQDHPPSRVHLLGMWAPEWFEPYPAVSGDSTAWIPRGPHNRQKTVEEWLIHYGLVDIPYARRTTLQLKLFHVPGD